MRLAVRAWASRGRASRIRAIAAVAAIALASPGSSVAQADAPPSLPPRLESVDGRAIDLAALAADRTVVVVTLKATWCPVCQRQLLRIKQRLGDLEPCQITFVVLAPGPAAQLLEIKARTEFPYPFVEDVDLEISRSLGLDMGGGQIAPAILMLKPDLTVGWMQRGRSAVYFGDDALVEEVACWNRV